MVKSSVGAVRGEGPGCLRAGSHTETMRRLRASQSIERGPAGA